MGFAILNSNSWVVAWSPFDNPPRPLQPGETVVAAATPEEAKPQTQQDYDANLLRRADRESAAAAIEPKSNELYLISVAVTILESLVADVQITASEQTRLANIATRLREINAERDLYLDEGLQVSPQVQPPVV